MNDQEQPMQIEFIYIGRCVLANADPKGRRWRPFPSTDP